MRQFRKGLICTAAPIALLSALSTAGAAAGAFYWFWFISAVLWVLAMPVGLGLLVARRPRLAGGVFAGVALGAMALAGGGLANIITVAA